MAGKPQKLTQGQKEEVVSILRKKVLCGVLTGFAILAGITGLSLWGIYHRVTAQMQTLVAKQFEEPRIQQIVQNAAAERASVLMTEQITPEVDDFKKKVNQQLQDLYVLVKKIQKLAAESRKYEQAMQNSLAKIQDTENMLASLRSDVKSMLKHIVYMQYYQWQGQNKIPNPYSKEAQVALNRLLKIAIPDPVERKEFAAELKSRTEHIEKKKAPDG